MRRIEPVLTLSVRRLSLLLTLLLVGAVPGVAQRTVVQDAGGGRKVELHYNAADQVTETRTLGPDGQLLQKDVLEYSPGAVVPQSVTTSYWPNGKVHRFARNTYDNNSNFTGEFIQMFDESGKQIAGHRLTHDPQTGVYVCNEWDVAAQDYKLRECPAGEESSGTPETVKKFTEDEVMQQLTKAREAQEKAGPQASVSPQPGISGREVGLVLPARIRPGQRVSGSVVENPGAYEGMPEVMVARVTLPFAPAGNGSSLGGWSLELSGEPPQPADGPIKLTIPPGQLELAVMFQQPGNAGAPVSKAISLPQNIRAKEKPTTTYRAPAICFKGQLCMISGPFSGDSSKTFAAIEERPARVVAESADAAFVAIPERTEAGSRPLVIAEGSKAIAFPMIVGTLTVGPDRRDLPQGETLLLTAKVAGPEELPDAAWRAGSYPVSNLEEAQKLVPGFQMPRAARVSHAEREAEEKREAQQKKSGVKDNDEKDLGGGILLVVKNAAPGQVTFRESKNGTYTFQLNAASFKMGEFQYKFVAEAIKSGNFAVESYVIPLLAPVAGQEFQLAPVSPGK